jgi:dienelactone hydrolase
MKRAVLASLGFFVATLVALSARADSKGTSVDYKHGDLALEGYLACDETTPEKRPGVLVVHEYWGLNDYPRRRADELAKLGYVAFAIDMYGKGVVAKDSKEAGALAKAVKSDRKLMRERATAGLSVLKAHKLVDPARIAAIGYCFGGTTVLELARSGAPVAGVVSFHGGLDTPDPKDASNIKGKVLVCNGADDPSCGPKAVAAFEDEMRAAHVDWQVMNFGGAVHGFTNSGNKKAYNEAADRRSWAAMRAFFDEIFASK